VLENLCLTFSSAPIFGNSVGTDTKLCNMDLGKNSRVTCRHLLVENDSSISEYLCPDSISLGEAYKTQSGLCEMNTATSGDS